MVIAVESDSIGVLFLHKVGVQRQVFSRHGCAVRPSVLCIAREIIVGHDYSRVPTFQMVTRIIDVRIRRKNDRRSNCNRTCLCIACGRKNFQRTRVDIVRQRCSSGSRSLFCPHCVQRDRAIYHKSGEISIITFAVERTSTSCIQLPANEVIAFSFKAAARDTRHLVGVPFCISHRASCVFSIFFKLHCIFGIVLRPLGIEPLRSITTWPRVANIERI